MSATLREFGDAIFWQTPLQEVYPVICIRTSVANHWTVLKFWMNKWSRRNAVTPTNLERVQTSQATSPWFRSSSHCHWRKRCWCCLMKSMRWWEQWRRIHTYICCVGVGRPPEGKVGGGGEEQGRWPKFWWSNYQKHNPCRLFLHLKHLTANEKEIEQGGEKRQGRSGKSNHDSSTLQLNQRNLVNFFYYLKTLIGGALPPQLKLVILIQSTAGVGKAWNPK